LRLDVFLSETRLIKRRTQAKKACEQRIVLVDGEIAKPAKEIKVGQVLTLNFSSRTQEVEILGIPSGNVKKQDASHFYKIRKEIIFKRELLD
jgi:ribosomal 50S subunit-recycling heat shock protein